MILPAPWWAEEVYSTGRSVTAVLAPQARSCSFALGMPLGLSTPWDPTTMAALARPGCSPCRWGVARLPACQKWGLSCPFWHLLIDSCYYLCFLAVSFSSCVVALTPATVRWLTWPCSLCCPYHSASLPWFEWLVPPVLHLHARFLVLCNFYEHLLLWYQWKDEQSSALMSMKLVTQRQEYT